MEESQLRLKIDQLAQLLTQNRLMLATAESCTGGLIAKLATDLTGSSAWFDRGFVTYSNQSKIDLLKVRPKTLEHHGAVSFETVDEMLSGVFNFAGIDVAVAVSGIAGPGGGTKEKPVGTVYIGWKKRECDSVITRFEFEGDREQVRMQAAAEAIDGISRLIA